MKKLLSVLSSAVIIGGTAIPVVACSPTSPEKDAKIDLSGMGLNQPAIDHNLFSNEPNNDQFQKDISTLIVGNFIKDNTNLKDTKSSDYKLNMTVDGKAMTLDTFKNMNVDKDAITVSLGAAASSAKVKGSFTNDVKVKEDVTHYDLGQYKFSKNISLKINKRISHPKVTVIYI